MHDVDSMTEAEVRRELAWWRHFASKLSRSSELPRVGSAIRGRRYTLREDPL